MKQGCVQSTFVSVVTVGDGLLLQNPQKAAGLWFGVPTDFGTTPPVSQGVGLRLIDPQGESGLILGATPVQVSPPIPVSPPTLNSVSVLSTTSLRATWVDNQTIAADSFTVFVYETVSETEFGIFTGLTGQSYDITGLTEDISYDVWVTAIVGGVSSGISNVIPATPQSTGPAIGVLFYDDFSTGNFSHTDNGIYWWYGKPIDGYPANSVIPVVNTSRPEISTHSIDFWFKSTARDLGELSMAMCEERFRIGYQTNDIWVRYALYIPSNYQNRAWWTSSTKNNKIMYLDGPPDCGWFIGFESWPGNIVAGASTWGEGSAYMVLSRKNAEYYGEYHDHYTTPHMPYCNINAGDRGKWHEFIFHCKISTAIGANNGAIEVWRNGTKIYEKLNVANASPDPNNAYFDSGYIQGWQNSGYDEDTHIYIDGFTISDSTISPQSGYPHA